MGTNLSQRQLRQKIARLQQRQQDHRTRERIAFLQADLKGKP